MSAVRQFLTVRSDSTRGLAYQLRVVRVLAGSAFKLKYADSALGYVWSLAKPLALFSILYVVFGLLIRFSSFDHYALYLLLGIVLFNFFGEATSTTMTSVVERGSLIRKMAFPLLVIPVSATVTAAITFAVNLVAIVAFVAWNRIIPRLDWLLLLPLLAELYLFGLGVALVLATLYVRFRDVGQIWELVAQLLFYLTPVLYPLQLMPEWGQRIVLLNPLAQMIQDARAVLLYSADVLTIPTVWSSSAMRLVPFALVVLTFLTGLVLFKRNEPWFAERA